MAKRKFEFRVIARGTIGEYFANELVTPATVARQLNDFGQSGWSVFLAEPNYFYLQREIEE